MTNQLVLDLEGAAIEVGGKRFTIKVRENRTAYPGFNR
jgi:hypothetical protein